MFRIARAFTAAALYSLATSQAAAADMAVEAEPVARHQIVVTPADFSSSDRQKAVRKQVRTAAHAVCREQYPVETTYLHSRACYVGTVRDAFDQLRKIETRWAKARLAPPAQVAILMRPH